MNWRITVLQTAALPLGYAAKKRGFLPKKKPISAGTGRLPVEPADRRRVQIGARDGGRTRDVYLGKVELYH